ncbi:immunoglobulin domain-containing protein, partial [Verrucomicrobia bacterium]|nr:immunoglobulin domain-containing protein [Verrucomicrobiota bacterium]
QGEPLKMSVAASGTTLKYQWYKGAAPVGGASAANYVVEQTQAVDAGDYFVVISNDKGVQASLPIKVSFGARLSVALDGANLTFAVDPGSSDSNWKLQRSSNLLFWEDVQALSQQDLEGLEMPVGDGSVFYRVVEQ